jgi:hypothetical protein
MMKDKLIKTASVLNQPSASVAQEFLQKHVQLAELGNQTMANRSDIDKLVGKDNQKMAEDNNRNFARFMASIFESFDPNVLVETVLWVFRAYRSHGFQTTYWAANLNIWTDMIRQELTDESYNAVYPFYNWLIVNIPIFVKLSDDHLSGSTEPGTRGPYPKARGNNDNR